MTNRDVINSGTRGFKVCMIRMARGLTSAELYNLIAADYDFYGAMPIARPVTAKERLNASMPPGVQRIIEPMLVFVGSADAPEIILQGPEPVIVD